MVPGRRSLGCTCDWNTGNWALSSLCFPASLKSSVVLCCVLSPWHTVYQRPKAPGPTNVESAEDEQSKPPSSCCGHFVPQPGSWLRLYLVHTDLISSFSHCYRRHFMISVFLNLLRFLWSTMICSGKWPGCIWENYIYSSIVGRCISIPIHLSPIFLLICLVTNMTEIKILKFLLF